MRFALVEIFEEVADEINERALWAAGCSSMMRTGAGSAAAANLGEARRARRRSWPPWSSMMRAGR